MGEYGSIHPPFLKRNNTMEFSDVITIVAGTMPPDGYILIDTWDGGGYMWEQWAKPISPTLGQEG